MTDYATTAQVKNFTRVAFTDFADLTTAQFDALVVVYITYASREMESYCGGRDWAKHDETATGRLINVGPQNARMLRIPGPVVSITSVESKGNQADTFSVLDVNQYVYENFPGYASTPQSAISHILRTGFGLREIGRMTMFYTPSPGSTSWQRWRSVFWRSYESVRIKYIWGYNAVPDEITRICVMIVDDWLKKALKDMLGKRIKATAPEDLQMIMRYDIPTHLRKSLDAWKSTSGVMAV